jgi:hypothetical protein
MEVKNARIIEVTERTSFHSAKIKALFLLDNDYEKLTCLIEAKKTNQIWVPLDLYVLNVSHASFESIGNAFSKSLLETILQNVMSSLSSTDHGKTIKTLRA